MKKLICLLLIAAMFALGACGAQPTTGEAPDLNAYYTDYMNSLGENAPMMMEITPDAIAMVYPGLEALTLRQCVLQTAAISAVTCEFALVECESEQDAATAAEILEARIDSQIAGGAWYPANIEAWQNAEVIVNGNVVALIAMGDGQQQAVDAFNALFA